MAHNQAGESSHIVPNDVPCEDRISRLPEDVMANIVIRLPTMQAVQTSVLSRAWRSVWTRQRSLDFEDLILNSNEIERKLSFLRYVQNVMRRCTTPKIHHFSLICYQMYEQHVVYSWLSSVLRRGVEIFTVRFRSCGLFVFPATFFDCQTLQDVELALPCIMNLPLTTRFTNLKVLHISKIMLQNPAGNDSKKLVFDFPVIEELVMMTCMWKNVKELEIKAPRLTNFQMMWSKYDFGGNNFVVEVFQVNLPVSTGLQTFKWAGYFIEKFLLSMPSTVCAASLDHIIELHDYHQTGAGAAVLLDKFRYLVHLEISIDVAEAMERAGSLPFINVLYHLKSMKVVARFTGSTRALMEFLRKTPCLETLEITSSLFWKHDDIELIGTLPYCVVMNLKRIFFTFRFGSCVSLYLAKMFLREAEHLELLQVIAHDLDELSKLEVTAQLMMANKAAPNVAIDVLP